VSLLAPTPCQARGGNVESYVPMFLAGFHPCQVEAFTDADFRLFPPNSHVHMEGRPMPCHKGNENVACGGIAQAEVSKVQP
jgi:hypothetical protein